MWLIVVNRNSGRGKVDKKLKDLISLIQSFSIPYKVLDFNSASETENALKSEISTKVVAAVVAIGGDGLVSLCVQQLAKTDIGFTVIPTGTGNDFARAIGTYRKSTADIFASIDQKNSANIDLGHISNRINGKYFVQVASCGFDALVNKLANQIKWPIGKSKYTLAMLFILPKFKPIKFLVKHNGIDLQQNAMLVAIANGSSYGGGMKILPAADVKDGVLDLLYVDPVSKLTLLGIFPRVFFGTHVNHPAVHIIRSQEFSISADTTAYADGELIGDLPIEVSVARNALKIWKCK
jgi:diacylglycerol kinase (ATP)